MTPEPAIEVTVVVPVYRNRDQVTELCRRLCGMFRAAGLRGEIVFVNDACPDGSLEVLEKLAASDDRVTVLDLEQNVGQHWAVLTGLGCARGVT